MGNPLLPYNVPRPERGFGKVHRVECASPGPFLGLVVVGEVPQLLEFIKSAGNAAEIRSGRSGLAGKFTIGELLRGLPHWPMLENPGQSRALARQLPITHRFPNQQMKQRIILCRDSPPQARLFGFCSLPLRKVRRLLE